VKDKLQPSSQILEKSEKTHKEKTLKLIGPRLSVVKKKMYYDVYTSGGGTQQRIRDCVLPKTDDFFCDGDAREIREEFDKPVSRLKVK
jgi:hypothetical protein